MPCLHSAAAPLCPRPRPALHLFPTLSAPSPLSSVCPVCPRAPPSVLTDEARRAGYSRPGVAPNSLARPYLHAAARVKDAHRKEGEVIGGIVSEGAELTLDLVTIMIFYMFAVQFRRGGHWIPAPRNVPMLHCLGLHLLYHGLDHTQPHVPSHAWFCAALCDNPSGEVDAIEKCGKTGTMGLAFFALLVSCCCIGIELFLEFLV